MTTGDPAPRITEEEYLALEESSDVKHDFIGGRLVAMAGGSDRHNAIGANLVAGLHNRLRETRCRPVGSDQRHKVEATGNYTYADVMIRCWSSDDPRSPLRVRVVFEVLSGSTEAYDRGEKFAHYREDPDIQEYVLVSQRERRVEHFRRVDVGRWELTVYGPDDVVALPAAGVELPVHEIYLDAARYRSDDAEDPWRLG